MLLILTSDQDFTADYLIVELIRRQLPYFRLNAEELAEAKFMFSIDERGLARSISLSSRSLDLRDVTSVWYRRSIHPIPKAPLTQAERYFLFGELRHLAMGLVWNPHITWVNPIDKVSVAEHKLYQLQIAARLGLQVPRTLVSADVERLRRFASGNAAGTVCKPIFHGMFFDGLSGNAIYTRRLDIDSLDKGSLQACPILLQEEIPRIADVRATFIGGHCFVVDIRGDRSLIDWRAPNTGVEYAVSSLDDVTVSLCREMLTQV